MRIGILGAGNMAEALGTQWVRAGHELMVGARSPAKAAALLGPTVRIGGLAEAAGFGDVTLLAVPEAAIPDVLSVLGDALRSRVLIDCTNSVVPGRWVLATPPGTSIAAQVAAATEAHVVKAFNLCHHSVWRRTPPSFDGRPLTVPLCGDHPDAIQVVRTLVTDLGCQPGDGGSLERAALLEATATFMIGLWSTGADAQATLPPLTAAFG